VAPQHRSTAFTVLSAVAVSHLLNDTIQALIPAIYPLLKSAFALTFAQVGLMTLTQQVTASLLQPVVGYYTDRRPTPYSLVVGMTFTMIGLLVLAGAPTFPVLLAAAGLMGIGSSVFHPEASRVARMASGGRYGLAQSLFQVGGNVGSAFGPLLGAFLVAPRGQASIAWAALLAVAAIVIMWYIGRWYAAEQPALAWMSARSGAALRTDIVDRPVARPIAILAALIFSKYFYLAGLNSYYTFFLISKFGVSVQTAQIDLFVFLAAVAVGTIAGGPIADRIGVKYVIWISILGVLPFTLALPYANLFWTPLLTIAIGLVLASAFSAIVVYAQELVPGRVGLISGLFFGFAFGVAGIGAAILGRLADAYGIETVYRICAFLPAIGTLTALLPDLEVRPRSESAALSSPRLEATGIVD
jgi:FSR family fosmidomycin resistance protein-like MFS transporter